MVYKLDFDDVMQLTIILFSFIMAIYLIVVYFKEEKDPQSVVPPRRSHGSMSRLVRDV
jgi:hypothetical protein